MAFERFDETGRGRGRPAGADPMISLRKSGSIGINQPALSAYFEDSDGAVMYYNEDANQVGIEPVADSDAEEAAYTISKTDAGGTIAPRAFLETYDLIPSVTTQFEPTWDEDRELVVIDLDDPIGTYGSPDEADVQADADEHEA